MKPSHESMSKGRFQQKNAKVWTLSVKLTTSIIVLNININNKKNTTIKNVLIALIAFFKPSQVVPGSLTHNEQ